MNPALIAAGKVVWGGRQKDADDIIRLAVPDHKLTAGIKLLQGYDVDEQIKVLRTDA